MVLKFSFKLVLYLGLVFGSLYGVQRVVDEGLRNSVYKEFQVWNDIYHSRINADLIIIGSSRASAHFSPRILDSALRLNSYNFGMEGYDFKMQYAKLRVYLEHNQPPAYLISSMDIYSLYKRDKLFDYEQFLPYLNDTIIQRLCREGYGHKLNALDFYIPFYKYYTEPALVAEAYNALVLKTPPASGIYYKGFKPYNERWNHTFEKFKKEHPEQQDQAVSNDQMDLFETFLGDCRRRHIKVAMVYSPEFYEMQQNYSDRDSIMQLYTDVSKKYAVPFLDYSKDAMCYDTTYLLNSQHLNKWGADVFTEKLATDLKRIHWINAF